MQNTMAGELWEGRIKGTEKRNATRNHLVAATIEKAFFIFQSDWKPNNEMSGLVATQHGLQHKPFEI